MSEQKFTPGHTPGPWKVRAASFCDDGIPSYEVVMPGDPQMNACDARLIAAAPDLLEACKRALPYLRDQFSTSAAELIAACEAAITKATESNP